MLQFQTGSCRGEEQAAHRRRVEALRRRVAGFLQIGPKAQGPPDAAPKNGGTHQSSSDSAARTCASSLEAELASEVLEICNQFDEALEFSAFERTTIPAAIAEFHYEAATLFSGTVCGALTRATRPDSTAPRHEQLPVLPRAATQLMRTSDESTSPAELRSIADTDPVLCARLLQVANSARFGGREPVSGARDAAARLGVPLARKAMLSACFAPLFASKPLQELWKHSQQVAAAAAEAAHRASFDPDLAYTAGLLHDIGRLVFETGGAASQIRLREWTQDGFPLTCAEVLTYGKDHGAAGAELLRRWELPPVLTDAVEHHHQPEMADSMLASLIFLAVEWIGSKTSGAVPEAMAAALRLRHAERLSGLTLDVFADWQSRSELLALAG